MQTKTIFELLHESSRAITSEIELEKVVQRVTDIGTELTGAQFGAFFYNVINDKGETLVLYTISGVEKEAFSKFPMPRNTKIFSPTFEAKGTIRYDDVTSQPHYGQNAPYHGMPKGHLPVRSYLAVPVVSTITKEAIGGLFFGHSDAGVFTEEVEKLIEGVAIQAAIAITNARLFQEKKQTEKILVEQREQYRSIFNATTDSAIIYDEQGIIVEANPSATHVFGYTYDELIGLSSNILFKDPKDFEALKHIGLSGRNYSGINTRLRKDGTEFQAEYKGSQFLYKGKPHILSIIKDLTAELKTEKALEESEQLSEAITSVSPVVLWMTNVESETIYINKVWLEWVGGRMEEHLGSGWLNAIVPEDRSIAREAFENAFAERKVFTADFRIKRKSGEIRWCATQGSPYYNKADKFSGFAGSLSDITERKEAERKLESQNILINTIALNTQQAMFLMNDKQVCTYMNPAAEKMTGFRLSEVQERPLHYYIHHTHPDGRHFPIEECAIDRALPTKSETQGEEVFINKEGKFFTVFFTASPIIEDGVPVGTVIEVRDTTEEKRIQEELRSRERQAMEMLERKVKERTAELERSNYELMQFTSIASHDLKEPVRKISIFSKMMQDKLKDELDDRSSGQLQSIVNASLRMANLIDDLLTFSRLSHTNDHFENVELNVLMQRIAEDLEIPIREKNGVIKSGQLPVIRGIPVQMGQLFQNLISNSLKFSHPDRVPEIILESTPQERNGVNGHLILYSDNGIGFRSDQSEKIFEVFYRLHSRQAYEGTGVGLAIVKKIVDLHKGYILAKGYEHIGAEFHIWLPGA